jgi:hypothetical protein
MTQRVMQTPLAALHLLMKHGSVISARDDRGQEPAVGRRAALHLRRSYQLRNFSVVAVIFVAMIGVGVARKPG